MCTRAYRVGGVVATSTIAWLFATTASAQLKNEKVLSYEAAKVIATIAVETRQAKGYWVSAMIVNRDGDTIVPLRGDGSPHSREQQAQGLHGEHLPSRHRSLRQATQRRRSGGAAISGSPGGNDEVCVQAGLDKAKDLLSKFR
jgi:hypothetical protein